MPKKARASKARTADALAPLRVELPKLWRPARSARGLVVVEHADLDCRSIEALLALSLARGGNAVLVSADVQRARWRAMDWLQGRVLKRHAIGGSVLGMELVGGSSIWLADAEKEWLRDLPLPLVDFLAVTGAERLREDPGRQLAGRAPQERIYSGVIAAREHWFHKFCRDVGSSNRAGTLLRFTAEMIAESFPDQAPMVLPSTDPRSARLMQLQDEDVRTLPFIVFARRRLHVRTDKEPGHLTQEQVESAREQLGPTWEVTRSGTPVVPMHLLPLQRRYLAMKRLAAAKGKRHTLLLKYRRGGFTTQEQGESYSLAVTKPRSYVATLAHDMETTARIFRMVKLFHEFDPEAPATVGDPSSKKIEFVNGSFFFIGTAGSKSFGRGDTLQRYHGSEVSRWLRGPNQYQDVQDLVAGLTGAASHGSGVLETTPFGQEWFCINYREAKQGRSIFFPAFLPWFVDPTNVAKPGSFNVEEMLATMSEEEKSLILKHGLTPEQIAFRRERRLEYGRLFAQEMPEDDDSCFLSSGINFFDPETIAKLRRKIMPYERKHIPGGYTIEWEPPIEGDAYVMGVDTSEGIPGGDPNGIGILHKKTARMVYAVHGIFRPKDLAKIVVDAAKRYNRALVGVERENHGHAVLQEVIDLGYGKPHYRGGRLYHFATDRAGWSTNKETRPVILDALYQAMEEEAIGVLDTDFLSECSTFRMQTGGKFAADAGAHDDCVMKWAIAYEMRNHAPRKAKAIFLDGTI